MRREISIFEEGNCVTVREIEGFGDVGLEGKVHGFDACGGAVVEGTADRGNKVSTADSGILLGDGFIADGDFEGLGVSFDIENGRLDIGEDDEIAEFEIWNMLVAYILEDGEKMTYRRLSQ